MLKNKIPTNLWMSFTISHRFTFKPAGMIQQFLVLKQCFLDFILLEKTTTKLRKVRNIMQYLQLKVLILSHG